MPYRIHLIEGVEENEQRRLERIGIRNTDDLLRRCSSPVGRSLVSGETGLSEQLILRWVHLADLLRIGGVGVEYAGLLDAVGVATLVQLRRQNPVTLTDRLRTVNAARRIARALPTQRRVAGWIDQAKSLRPTISC